MQLCNIALCMAAGRFVAALDDCCGEVWVRVVLSLPGGPSYR
jgi:hypothetical protein